MQTSQYLLYQHWSSSIATKICKIILDLLYRVGEMLSCVVCETDNGVCISCIYSFNNLARKIHVSYFKGNLDKALALQVS